jgi:hypothetical protein
MFCVFRGGFTASLIWSGLGPGGMNPPVLLSQVIFSTCNEVEIAGARRISANEAHGH